MGKVRYVSWSLAAKWIVFSLLQHFSLSEFEEKFRGSFDPCSEFTSGRALSSWTRAECMEVWMAWAETIPWFVRRDYPDRQEMKWVALEMRQRGQPCVVQPADPFPDGVGSEFTRQFAAWLFAKEVGCDWVTPHFGYKNEIEHEKGSGTLYCHDSATPEEFESGGDVEINLENCEVANWLEYFNLEGPSVPLPNATFHDVQGAKYNSTKLENILHEIESRGLDDFPDDFRLRFTFFPDMPSVYVVAARSWDQYKRKVTRRVMSELRTNFHRFPRPWFDKVPNCGYSKTQLNFAMHIRMGDRRAIQGNLATDYFDYLHEFMDLVTEAVVAEGLEPPLFHAYTETLYPCPSSQTRMFQNFPKWPVIEDEIAPCLNATRPPYCPERRAGAEVCNVNRTGMFHVEGRPLVLHVGGNVRECITCMIQADGVLMGCSTFGQVVGWLTNGLKFFSVACAGDVTPSQYQMTPPLAVAERGYMYVPMSGKRCAASLGGGGPAGQPRRRLSKTSSSTMYENFDPVQHALRRVEATKRMVPKAEVGEATEEFVAGAQYQWSPEHERFTGLALL